MSAHRGVGCAVLGVSLLSLAGCVDATGPVVGDWRGHEPSAVTSYQTSIEVILDGSPGARSGTYHYDALNQGEDFEGGDRHLAWTDRWTMRPVTIGGQTMQAVHLDRLVGGRIGNYILTPQGSLVPQADPAHPDLSANAYRLALLPVPRDTFGYGRP